MVEMAKTGVFLESPYSKLSWVKVWAHSEMPEVKKKIRNEEKQKSWLYIANGEGFLSFQSSIEENAAPELS